MNKILAFLGALVILCVGFLYDVFAIGYVGMKLWSWYLVPTFGFPILSLIQAWGIALVCRLWT